MSTSYGVAIIVSMISLTIVGLGAYRVIVHDQQAAHSADVVAIAAATAYNSGVQDPCATAEEFAGRNGVTLTACEPDALGPGSVRVTVTAGASRSRHATAGLAAPGAGH